MKLLKISLLSLAMVFSLVGTVAFGEVVAEKETGSNSFAFPLSDVSDIEFSNFEIISQEGNSLNISFSLNNGERTQTGVKYAISLSPKDDYKIGATEEYVYPESLTLDSSSELTRKINYKAPSGVLAGDYFIRVCLKNKDGLFLGLSEYKEVSFNAEGGVVSILEKTCSISGKNLSEKNIIIPQGEDALISCSVKNNSEEEIKVDSNYEVYLNNLYGELLSKNPDVSETILPAGKETEVIWNIPAVAEAQTVKIFLSNENISSNKVVVSYSYPASEKKVSLLNNINLDKTYYRKGDQAVVSFSWINTDFEGQDFVLKASILNKDGEVCLPETTKAPVTIGKITLTGEIIKKCSDPRVLAKIENKNGEVVAENDLVFQTVNKPQLPILDLVILILIIILVVAGIVIFFIKPKNKKDELKNIENNNHEINN